MTTARSNEMTDRLDGDARDDEALGRLVEGHYPRLLVLARLVSGDSAAAEDIVQTALERAWRARRTIRDGDRLRPWLDRIVVREAARERRSRLAWLDRLVRPPQVTDISPVEPDPVDRRASRFPDRSELRSALAGLTASQRAALVLTLHAGYSVDEAAAILGVPRDTVRSRLRSAREHLRYALKEGG